ncbi:hypothetical protein L3Y34_008954 [Caenorhabditis briggsae]|uniref:Uncharacterized protein n=2 Tax=Caenorhabditis briggsae TaxID=6238 RepID=A0AAE9AB22_CAEBR|nr:hypothetical protein L3Y34_008954 [Caenorhabditis briggsae]
MDSPESSLPSLIEDDSPRFQYVTINWNSGCKSFGIPNVEVIEIGTESQKDDDYSLTTSFSHKFTNHTPDLEMSFDWWNPPGFSNHYIFLPDSGIYDKLISQPWTSPSTEFLRPKYVSNGLPLASMLTPLRKNLKLIKRVPTSEIAKYIKPEDLEKNTMSSPDVYFLNLLTTTHYERTMENLKTELIPVMEKCSWFARQDTETSFSHLFRAFREASVVTSRNEGDIQLLNIIGNMLKHMLENLELSINKSGDSDRVPYSQWFIKKFDLNFVDSLHNQYVLQQDTRHEWHDLSMLSAFCQVNYKCDYPMTSNEWAIRLSAFCVLFFKTFIHIFNEIFD